jgi:hypothetical protein
VDAHAVGAVAEAEAVAEVAAEAVCGAEEASAAAEEEMGEEEEGGEAGGGGGSALDFPFSSVRTRSERSYRSMRDGGGCGCCGGGLEAVWEAEAEMCEAEVGGWRVDR